MNKQLLFNNNLKLAHAPVDLNTAAITGARISLAKGEKIAILLLLGSSVGASVVATLKQHDASVGGTTKALEVANKYYHKAGAATVFTEVEPTVATDSYDLSAQFATDGGVAVLEINESDLDVDGGFSHISVDIADSGAAKIGATAYVVMNADYCPAYSESI